MNKYTNEVNTFKDWRPIQRAHTFTSKNETMFHRHSQHWKQQAEQQPKKKIGEKKNSIPIHVSCESKEYHVCTLIDEKISYSYFAIYNMNTKKKEIL